jgi:hypothetical protein
MAIIIRPLIRLIKSDILVCKNVLIGSAGFCEYIFNAASLAKALHQF